jgi:CBS domain-containing protein
MRLSEVLRSKPVRIVSLPPSASAVEAAALMKEEEVGAVLICDARRRIVGILSERDLAVAIAAYGPDLSRHREPGRFGAGRDAHDDGTASPAHAGDRWRGCRRCGERRRPVEVAPGRKKPGECRPPGSRPRASRSLSGIFGESRISPNCIGPLLWNILDFHQIMKIVFP